MNSRRLIGLPPLQRDRVARFRGRASRASQQIFGPMSALGPIFDRGRRIWRPADSRFTPIPTTKSGQAIGGRNALSAASLAPAWSQRVRPEVAGPMTGSA